MHMDDIMKDIWYSLVRDFRAIHGPDLLRDQELALQAGMKHFRSVAFPGIMKADIHLHKVVYQMQSLFKRYIFQKDAFTGEELKKQTISEHLAYQQRLGQYAQFSYSGRRIMQKARVIVKDVLGQYDLVEHLECCAFGKRAAVGIPAVDAYLDTKCATLSGSPGHMGWFLEKALRSDHTLATAVSSCGRSHKDRLQFTPCDALTYTAVPKTWKSLRGILPNSVVGSFHSYGFGKVIQRRLCDRAHLDIRRLQEVHKVRAKIASRNRKHVTLDLRKASEGFRSDHINRMVPRAWYTVAKEGRIASAVVDGDKCYNTSFMAMGLGFTFPLQTLLFYAIISAVSMEFVGHNRGITVYGDDCIYPSNIHRYVLWALRECQLEVNVDKTFHDCYFRESCGGDYYHGVDVRPYAPEIASSELSKGRRGEMTLYKILNGLLLRWDEQEIPATVKYLKELIAQRYGRILIVPPSFPDSAGFKSNTPYPGLDGFPYARVYGGCLTSKYLFEFLGESPEHRPVRCVFPYYWNQLRINFTGDTQWSPWDQQPLETLSWRRCKPRKFVRGYASKKRIELLRAFVPSKSCQPKVHLSVADIPVWD